MSEKNIYQKLSAITAEIKTVGKNLEIAMGKGKGYKAVGEVDILNAVKPLEEKHGVYSYPMEREIVETKELTNQYGSVSHFVKIKTLYRAVNIDKPSEYIDTVSFSTGVDTQDKGDGKAMTYGDKYALMKLYKISTGDDPDQNASEEYTKEKPKDTKAINELQTKLKGLSEENGKEITTKAFRKALAKHGFSGWADWNGKAPDKDTLWSDILNNLEDKEE